jgi:hypothetical protein
MSRDLGPVGLGGPLVDRDGVNELTPALGQPLAARVAHGPAGAQATSQVAAERPTVGTYRLR